MSVSFFDLMKYASTGIASPSMTAYDKMRALAAFGGGKTQTLTGIPPLSFKANGKPLISWSMLGNGQQTGTPTPDAPIMPEFVGERTGNLFDISRFTVIGDGAYSIDDTTVTMVGNSSAGLYYLTWQEYEAGTYTFTFESDTALNCFYVIASDFSLSNCTLDGGTLTTSAPVASRLNKSYAGYKTTNKKSFTITSDVPFYFAIAPSQSSYTISHIMLNTGSTALPYEPYGWAEKITCAGQTTPVYLGQVSTVRRVKKLVLTGKESGQSGIWRDNWWPSAYVLIIKKSELFAVSHYGICTHYALSTEYPVPVGNFMIATFEEAGGYTTKIGFNIDGFASLSEWKSYLAQQYSNGTPVTVWYVLAEPETAIVNEPLAKIGDYADELHSADAGVSIPTAKGQNTLTVDTELQPSNMTITGNIKEI